MDGPTVKSTLESYTQVGLWDRRREAAIQASKKEKKTCIHCHGRSCSGETTPLTRDSSPAVRAVPEKPTWGRARDGSEARRSPSLANVPGCSPEGIRF